jgi:hypothetical protein
LDRLVLARLQALSAALAPVGVIDVDMAVAEQHSKPENSSGARSHALPAALAEARVDPDEGGAVVPRERAMPVHHSAAFRCRSAAVRSPALAPESLCPLNMIIACAKARSLL